MKTKTPRFLAMGLLVYFLVQGQYVLAHLPELYGREYIRLDVQPQGVAPEAAENAVPLPSKQDELQYDKQIEQAEISGGPFAEGLADPLINLGYYHYRRGDLDRSIAAYRRALHLIRVNDGLSSPQQVPVLRKMAGLYRSIGDLLSLGDVYQYYYRVRKLGEPPYTQERLDDSLEYLMWERELYVSRPDSQGRVHLLRAYQTNEDMLRSLVPKTARDLDVYIRLTMSQMHNLYLILGADPLIIQNNQIFSSDQIADDAVTRQLVFIQKTALSKGGKLLRACIEKGESLTPAESAALHLELGDWQQWNGELRQASQEYARVVGLLRDAGEEQLLIQWLGQPVELPDEPGLWQGISEQDLSGQVVVEARYTVTMRGEAKRVEVSAAEDDESWQASRIRRMLRDTHFRPRFTRGQPETVEDVSRRYVLLEPN